MDCWEEESVLGQIAEDIALRVLWRVDDQPLLIRVEVDLDHDLALKNTVVDDRAKHFLVAEALVDDADHHGAALVECTSSLSACMLLNRLMLLVLDLETPEMLTETVAVGSDQGSSFVKGEPLLPSLRDQLGAHQVWCLWTRRREDSTHVERLSLLRRNVGHI